MPSTWLSSICPRLPGSTASSRRNASDDARAQISAQLSLWKHPLDCRRKDDNRVRAQKWFTGEKWASFCLGIKGSPGGPRAIAAIVLIIAQEMQLNGTVAPDVVAAPAAAAAPTRPAGRGRGAFQARVNSAPPAAAPAPAAPAMASRTEMPYKPSAIEQAADPEDLKVIRDLFGSRAQTIINSLLAVDAFFAWYYPLKDSIDLDSSLEEREARALDNMRTAIDVHEIFERCSIRNHKSFMPHGAIFKVTRDILTVGDIWAYCLSALELQNAETKRIATSGGSRRLQMSSQRVRRGGGLGRSSLSRQGTQVRWPSPHCASSSAQKYCGVATASLLFQSLGARSGSWPAAPS